MRRLLAILCYLCYHAHANSYTPQHPAERQHGTEYWRNDKYQHALRQLLAKKHRKEGQVTDATVIDQRLAQFHPKRDPEAQKLLVPTLEPFLQQLGWGKQKGKRVKQHDVDTNRESNEDEQGEETPNTESAGRAKQKSKQSSKAGNTEGSGLGGDEADEQGRQYDSNSKEKNTEEAEDDASDDREATAKTSSKEENEHGNAEQSSVRGKAGGKALAKGKANQQDSDDVEADEDEKLSSIDQQSRLTEYSKKGSQQEVEVDQEEREEAGAQHGSSRTRHAGNNDVDDDAKTGDEGEEEEESDSIGSRNRNRDAAFQDNEGSRGGRQHNAGAKDTGKQQSRPHKHKNQARNGKQARQAQHDEDAVGDAFLADDAQTEPDEQLSQHGSSSGSNGQRKAGRDRAHNDRTNEHKQGLNSKNMKASKGSNAKARGHFISDDDEDVADDDAGTSTEHQEMHGKQSNSHEHDRLQGEHYDGGDDSPDRGQNRAELKAKRQANDARNSKSAQHRHRTGVVQDEDGAAYEGADAAIASERGSSRVKQDSEADENEIEDERRGSVLEGHEPAQGGASGEAATQDDDAVESDDTLKRQPRTHTTQDTDADDEGEADNVDRKPRKPIHTADEIAEDGEAGAEVTDSSGTARAAGQRQYSHDSDAEDGDDEDAMDNEAQGHLHTGAQQLSAGDFDPFEEQEAVKFVPKGNDQDHQQQYGFREVPLVIRSNRVIGQADEDEGNEENEAVEADEADLHQFRRSARKLLMDLQDNEHEADEADDADDIDEEGYQEGHSVVEDQVDVRAQQDVDVKPGNANDASQQEEESSQQEKQGAVNVVDGTQRTGDSESTKEDPHVHSTFKKIGKLVKADKVLQHDYAPLYERYLSAKRSKHLQLLEIGLGQGCEVPGLSVGDSLKLWSRYLPHSSISFIEIDKQCADAFAKKNLGGGKIYVGDQGDSDFLNEVFNDGRRIGGWDVIIDDGGHQMSQQIMSLHKLWPTVRPGGIYVVEAAITSYLKEYGGGTPGKEETLMTVAMQAMHSLNCVNPNVKKKLRSACRDHVFWKDAESINVFPEAVVFVKRNDAADLSMRQ